MPLSIPYQISPLGESAITIEFGKKIDAGINNIILSLFHYLQEKKITGVKDIIPAYSSFSVIYDTILIRAQSGISSAFEFIKQQIEKAIAECDGATTTNPGILEIPVCYDVSFGMDLDELAQQKNMSADAVIQMHCSKTYRVYMIGFLPGFAYMGPVDERIAMPRRMQPRIRVPAGSVGIAGEQTGIYPLDSPGGWNIIGRTPVKMFDAKRKEPVFLQAGDEVRFVQVGMEEFLKMS